MWCISPADESFVARATERCCMAACEAQFVQPDGFAAVLSAQSLQNKAQMSRLRRSWTDLAQAKEAVLHIT